ncbi:hypothetical protein TNCV_4997411 [Trichonephila clavipes]|nr:hypothetical protein TNCV_4997411 [Trichonephila clavipes]
MGLVEISVTDTRLFGKEGSHFLSQTGNQFLFQTLHCHGREKSRWTGNLLRRHPSWIPSQGSDDVTFDAVNLTCISGRLSFSIFPQLVSVQRQNISLQMDLKANQRYNAIFTSSFIIRLRLEP